MNLTCKPYSVSIKFTNTNNKRKTSFPKKKKKNTKVSSRVRKDQCSTNKTHQGYLNQSFLMLNATPPMSSLQLKEIFEAKIDKLKKET